MLATKRMLPIINPSGNLRPYRTFNVTGLACLILIFTIAFAVVPFPSHAGNLLKVGVLEEPKTLNIWLASDAWSRKVLRLIYQPLYTRDPDTLSLIPWLAKDDPVYDSKSNSYTVKLREAKWSDGTPVTAEDVAFTGRLIMEFNIPRHASKWKFIDKIEVTDSTTVTFYLKEPKAIFLSRTLITPIVSKKEWGKIAEKARTMEKPLTSLLNHEIKTPLGNGPFALKEWRQGAYLFLQPNELFFGKDQKIGNYQLGPYVKGLILKVFGTSDAAVLALRKNTIDYFWWKIQPGYIDELKKEKSIHLFTSEKSALYYLGFNCRKPPFDDVHFRRAVATLIDKDFIIKRVLQGQGIKMHSVVPPGNTFWHNDDVPLYGDTMTKDERIRKAYKIMSQAGYTWNKPPVNKKDKVVPASGLKTPQGEQVKKFTILTPPADYDPHRAMAGLVIQEWLRAIGMPVSARPMSFSALLEKVKVSQDFDAFVLGYGNLNLDPDYVRAFYHSRYDKVRGFNKTGYNNPDYDKIADQSANTMDASARRELIQKMQTIVLTDVPVVPLYNPSLIEAVRIDRFNGWVQTLNGIGNVWSFCQVKPN